MNSAALTPELHAAAPALSAGVAGILRNLMNLIASAFLRDPRHAALINPLWNYVSRTVQRFDRLMAGLAAGTLLPPRPRAPGLRIGTRTGSTPIPFPHRHAWLAVALGYIARNYASQLNHLLDQPGHAALLAATPRAQRLLRPLCHMLGIAPAALKPPAGVGSRTSRTPRRQHARSERTAPARPPAGRLLGKPPGALASWCSTSRAGARPPTRETAALHLRPPQPLCPRLLTRWPFAPHPKARPA
jgi:hypothetical protein